MKHQSYHIIMIMFGVSLLSACSQSSGSGTNQTSTEAPTAPVVQITDIAPGKSNIKIQMPGTAKDLFKVRACELGKYAQSKNAISVKTPDRTEVLAETIGRQSTVGVDQNFEYFQDGSSIPEGATTTENLLSQCDA